MAANQKGAFLVLAAYRPRVRQFSKRFHGVRTCQVINLLFDSKDVHREIQGELKFGEKLSAVQGIIGVIAGGRIAVCGARN